jgi:glycosyltransferase involved in cell wall biosynthesis
MVSQPLLSIVTPVYNGAKYLEECIESVCAQTYKHWEYIIVNNCSTDGTLEIANDYAKKDNRIRIVNNERLLNVIKNWNKSMNQISPESKYTKVVHADDWLFPECMERMVELAEKDKNIGIVGSYSLLGREVRFVGIPYNKEVVPGKDICRATFKGDFNVFGPPTVTLIRSDLVRKYKAFYDESILYADTEVCFKLLIDHDFGFVHQILSYVRLHEESVSAKDFRRMEILEFLGMLKKYGPAVFEKIEYEEVLRKRFNEYYRFLGKNVLLRRKKEFWQYHKNGLNNIGYSFSYRKLIAGFFYELIIRILNLQDTFNKIKSRLFSNINTQSDPHKFNKTT